MWCRGCQQDVPTRAGAAAGMVCPRCGRSLGTAVPTLPRGAVMEAGIELDAPQGRAGRTTARGELADPEARLKEIGRKLRARGAAAPPSATHSAEGWPAEGWPAEAWPAQAWPAQAGPLQSWPAEAGPAEAWSSELRPSELRPSELGPSELRENAARRIDRAVSAGWASHRRVRRHAPSTGLAMLLIAGCLLFASGAIGLAAAQVVARATAVDAQLVWRVALTWTLIGQGVLLLAVVWAVLRLWGASRRLTLQLDEFTAREPRSLPPRHRA